MSDEHPGNDEIAALFDEFADRLEATDVEYKPTAYRRAADSLRDHPRSVAALADDDPDTLEEIDRIGEAIASKIVEYVETGSIEELEALRGELPVEIDDLTRVEGVGPKTVGALFEALDVRTLPDLERAAREGQIQEVKGFGAKTEQNILDSIAFAKESRERELLGDARPVADEVLSTLDALDAVDRCEVAGSIRRWVPTVGDVDVLAASRDGEAVIEAFVEQGDDTIESGTSKASVYVGGVRVDLRVVAPDEYGSALQYFTGSKDHNVDLRNYALDRDVSLNEYGAFDVSDVDADDDPRTGERIAGETEASMYDVLDLEWIPPELREATGEIEAAANGDLPELLTVEDVRGDLHVHTDWSDGVESISSMVDGAAAFGHEYVAITDHAAGPGVVGSIGLSESDLREQLEEIRTVADDAEIDVFAGVETNVDADGTLSTSDELLADLDLVVASPHSALDGGSTERLIRAVEHPHVDVLGHPSGRLLNQRSGVDFDPRKLATAAADAGTALEINSNPARLDLWGEAVREAVEAGAAIAINTDAHAIGEYGHVRYGVHTARRGWAEPGDVLNTMGAEELRSALVE